MTGPERGLLLLGSHLGDPERRPMTLAQIRRLGDRVRGTEWSGEDRDMTEQDLKALGYGPEDARLILNLLAQEDLLEDYLRRGRRAGCRVLTRISPGYPEKLRSRLGLDTPVCLWLRGNANLLEKKMIALVGSRELEPENEAFAREAGRQAAQQGYVLVSGNARGADRTGQQACRDRGGSYISVVADELEKWEPRPNCLYLSEDGFGEPFSAQRALSRNRIIHALGDGTLVAQCRLEMGGTWSGTTQNLRRGWSPVTCFEDGSAAMEALYAMGAEGVSLSGLSDLEALCRRKPTLFDGKGEFL